jgi:catechol 2,3-dioxygenase-like lactoylglutathione lyase family enzyme
MRVPTIAAAIVLAGAVVSAQAPAPNPSGKAGAIGFMHAIHSTNDIDKTLAFYQAVFGLTGQVRPFQSAGPQILTDSPGATLRVAMTQLRGAFNFELTEFGNIERQMNKRPEIADPGAPMIKIVVRDLDAIVAAARKVNAPIVTSGGAPVMAPTSNGSARAILMRDPDGFFVEAIQGTPADGPGDGAVLGAIIGLTVRDTDETLRYWNGLLGLELAADPAFSSDRAMLDLLGLPAGASYAPRNTSNAGLLSRRSRHGPGRSTGKGSTSHLLIAGHRAVRRSAVRPATARRGPESAARPCAS